MEPLISTFISIVLLLQTRESKLPTMNGEFMAKLLYDVQFEVNTRDLPSQEGRDTSLCFRDFKLALKMSY